MARFREPKTSERRLRHAERQRQALELRKTGVSYEAIAEAVGLKSKSSAYVAVKEALDALIREPAEEVRVLEAERLDKLMLGLWNDATAGRVDAIDRVLKIMDRRAKLLGLDATPNQKIELSGTLATQVLEKSIDQIYGDPNDRPAGDDVV